MADPNDQGRTPKPPSARQRISIPARRLLSRATHRRRLALVDSHFPWRISGFRYDEAEELLRRRPDTMFFSLYGMTDPFPAEVHRLEDFPVVAPAAGVTDVYMVFFSFAAAILGIAGRPGIPTIDNCRPDISLREPMERWGMRAHATIYPGGGLFPGTDPVVLREIARSCATVFTSVPEVADVIPDAVSTVVPVPGGFYERREKQSSAVLRLVFVGDDRPRKGLGTLLDAMPELGPGFQLDVVGPHDRYADRLAAVGARVHGWLEPDALREVVWGSEVVVAPASRDLPEDGYGDEGIVDGFPTTAARVAMLSGCCLVGSNPLADHSLLRPGIEYVEVPERDPRALVDALASLKADPARRLRVAAAGADMLRERCDVSVVVGKRLARMGLLPGRAEAQPLVSGA